MHSRHLCGTILLTAGLLSADLLTAGSLLSVLTPLSGPAFAQTTGTSDETALSESDTTTPLPAISVEVAGQRLISERIYASGLIAPVEEVQIQPLIEGQPIEALLADVGDLVEAGQVLAELSQTTLKLQEAQAKATLAQARAAIAQAEAQLLESEAGAGDAKNAAERATRLRAQGAVSEAVSDSAEANATASAARVAVATQALEAARAQFALAETQSENVALMLSRTRVITPHAGRITSRNATLGAIATAASSPMFVLEKDAALELRADLAETDLLRLAPGQEVLIRASGPSAPVRGEVRLVEPSIDPASRLGRARISLPDAAPLRAGQFAEAEILITSRKAVTVPVSALGAGFILISEDGLIRRREVTTGIREGGRVEVLSGLSAGEVFVTRAGSFLREGDRIRPVTETALPAAGQ